MRTDHNLWPSISARDPLALRTWLGRLGFEEGGCYVEDDGTTVRHSEMLWPEGGRVMVSSAGKATAEFTSPVGTTQIYVVTDRPDDVHAAAAALGAEVVRPLKDEDYGSRGFSIRDPEGNTWSFGTYAG